MNDEAIKKGGSLRVPSDDLKRILAAAPPAVILGPDAPKFTVIYANPAFCRVAGAKAEELAGLGVLEIFPENPGDPERGNVRALLSSLEECVSFKKETHLPAQKYNIPVRGTREFKTKYWQVSNNPVLTAAGEVDYIIHLAVDITGAFELAKKEHIAFEVAEARRLELHSLFMEAPAGIVVFEGPDMIFQFVNPVYQSFFPDRELLGKPLLDALPELKEHPLVAGFRNTFETGETYIGRETETQFLRKANGQLETSYWNFIGRPKYNSSGEIDGILMFGFEVTEQVEARRHLEQILAEKTELSRMLKEKEQRLQSILDTMAEGLGIIDHTGQMIYANAMAQKILGVKQEDILTRTFNAASWKTVRLDGSPLPDEEHPMALTMATGKPVHDQIVGVTKPDSDILYVSINAAPIFDEGKVTGGIGTFTDVTSRILLMKQKDEFISTVSHELKTPVTSIKAYAQLLQKSRAVQENRSTQNFLERLNVQVNRLESLIKGFLDITRIDAGKLELNAREFEMHIALAGLVSDLQFITPGHQLIITRNQPLTVVAEENRIIQVLTNLITNAVKYSPGADKVLISLTADDLKMTCSVQDFGIGIPAEQKDHIFDRFHRAGNHYESSGLSLGLGLYISKEIIEKAGGEIWFESEPGKGSTFYFSLPAVVMG